MKKVSLMHVESWLARRRNSFRCPDDVVFWESTFDLPLQPKRAVLRTKAVTEIPASLETVRIWSVPDPSAFKL